MDFDQAVALCGLNRQNMDQPGTNWNVLATAAGEKWKAAAVEVIQVPSPAGGFQEVQIVSPQQVASRGDCSHCPASHLPCAS